MSLQPPSRRPSNIAVYALLALGAVAAGVYSRLRGRRRSMPNNIASTELARTADDEAPVDADSASAPEAQQPTPIATEPAPTSAGPSSAPSAALQGSSKDDSYPDDPRKSLRPVHLLLLVAILAVGFYFRFAGLNWDESEHVHPDELFLTNVLSAVEIPDSLGAYFDSATSPLNPRNRGHTFFVYGDFPITFTRLVAEGLTSLCAPPTDASIDGATGRPAPTLFDSLMRGLGFDRFCYRADGSFRPMTGYDELTFVGRTLSALFDLATLIWLFLIGRELYGTRAGLAAMALGALTVLHIQQAHFFTADSFATHFVTAAMYFIVRAAKTGAWRDFAIGGALSGLAMACRINVVPLFGILLVAAACPRSKGTGVGRVVQAWRDRGNWAHAELALLQAAVGFAALVITFRIFMPNAFSGLLSFDSRWQDNMASIQGQISGEYTSPPDVQWTDRKPIVFPWVNMVFWGLGLPLGLTAWAGWALATWQMLVRPYFARENRTIGGWLSGMLASPHVLIWVWVTGYFAWQSTQWVKSMRYLLPIYPFMAIFAGWALASVWDRARAIESRLRMRVAGYGLPAIVLAGTLLWAIAFTAIYRRPEARIAASEWIYENIPSAATLHYTDASGARDVHLQLPPTVTFEASAVPQVTPFTVPTDGQLTGLTFRSLTDPSEDALDESLTVIVAEDAEGSQIVAQVESFDSFQTADPSQRQFEVEFPPSSLSAASNYYLIGYTDSNAAPLDFSATIIVEAAGAFLPIEATPAPELPPGVLVFSVPADGTLISATATLTSAPTLDGEGDLLRVQIALDPGATQVIAQRDLSVPGGIQASAFTLRFDSAPLNAGQQYYFVGQATSGALIATSSMLANEHWDRGIPLRVGGRDGFSFYRGMEFGNYDDDTIDKLSRLIGWLDQADYVFLATNRLYGSIPRQPLRYPLTTEYYRLLFTGQLGFDLAAEFTSYPTLGPLEFPDQETTQALGLWPDPTRRPKPGVISVPFPPAEEAFSVYDHPRVLIFRKRLDFSRDDVIAKLSRIDLESAYHGFRPRDETGSPTGQMLSPQAWQTQQASSTWADLFDRNGLLNTSPGIGAIVWYVVIAALGWIVFPIAFVALPGLADRGYGLARTLAVLLLSFLIWFPASFRLLPFTRDTIILAAIGLAVVAGLILRARRIEITDFIRRSTRLILIEETVFAAAFGLFLLLRYGNPDLWNPWWGGEKPMDFAYFNAVIKSQYFPPYDPWFAGGFLTYYYYGWVMFAVPTKLLGIVPAIAYNLAVPTVYALAALGTFSVAHGLASRFGRGLGQRETRPAANGNVPMAIGVIAAVFVMLIGNLGEVKLIAEEVAKVGEPDLQGLNTTIPVLKDLMKLGNGFGKLLSGGQELPIPPNWYYWNPTRIIPADPGEAGPITEFPFFTFLYADLHAHMMALPITILLLGLAVSWLTHLPLAYMSGTERPVSYSVVPDPPGSTQYGIRNTNAGQLIEWLRANWAGLASLVLGGLSIGALRATNTADYPTYLIIAAAALLFGTWAAESWRAKETWLRFALRVGLLFVSALVLFSPFSQSDRLGSAVLDGWLGSKTPLQEYLYVHGIFLFPIVTYLFIELRRWGWRWLGAIWSRLSEWRWAIGVAGGVAALAIAYIWLALDAPVAVVAGPLMLVLFALMLRPRLSALTRFWLLMVFLSVSLSLVVEVVVFRGDISRMNMVFKFYYQVWVLLGIAGAVALGWLWQRGPIAMPKLNGGWPSERTTHAPRLRSGGWQTVMVVLVTGGLLYPPFAARAKLSERFTEGAPPGLDGMVYMRDGVYYEADELDITHELHLRWDYEAITWMQDNIAGTPVIAEGRSKHEYLWGSRVSIYTGLPTIVGWAHHQRQQRGAAVPHSVIEQRMVDVALLFGDPSQVTARKILDRYDVKYIYVGELEKAYYLPDALAKFEQMARDGELRVAYENPGVTIYEVIHE